MDKALLRSLMVLHGDTNKTLADYLEISERSLSAKINENGTEFNKREIALIRVRYSMDDELTIRCFFSD